MDVIALWQAGELFLSGSRNTIALGIGELLFAALWFFDGKTTLEVAVEQLAKVTSAEPSKLAQTLSDLMIVLNCYGFIEGASSHPLSDISATIAARDGRILD